MSRDALTKLTLSGAMWPRWTPDGKKVAFASTRETTRNIYVQAADGSGGEERLTSGPYLQNPSSWSPDGRFLAFGQVHPETNQDIYILPMEGDGKPYAFVNTAAGEEAGRAVEALSSAMRAALCPESIWSVFVAES